MILGRFLGGGGNFVQSYAGYLTVKRLNSIIIIMIHWLTWTIVLVSIVIVIELRSLYPPDLFQVSVGNILEISDLSFIYLICKYKINILCSRAEQYYINQLQMSIYKILINISNSCYRVWSELDA